MDYIEKDERCENCKFFHRLEKDFKTGEGYTKSSCCIMLTRCSGLGDDPDDYNTFVIETSKNGTCEMFTKRGGISEKDKETADS